MVELVLDGAVDVDDAGIIVALLLTERLEVGIMLVMV